MLGPPKGHSRHEIMRSRGGVLSYLKPDQMTRHINVTCDPLVSDALKAVKVTGKFEKESKGRRKCVGYESREIYIKHE